jgi:hypothetical protein
MLQHNHGKIIMTLVGNTAKTFVVQTTMETMIQLHHGTLVIILLQLNVMILLLVIKTLFAFLLLKTMASIIISLTIFKIKIL